MTSRAPHSGLPLVEVVAEIGCQLSAPSDLERFESVVAGERLRYPNFDRRVERHMTAGLRDGGDVVVVEDERLLGHVLTDTTGLEVHALVGSFSWRCMEGFESWPLRAAEGARMWERYRDAVSPERLTHLAIRYIMHIPGVGDARSLRERTRFAPILPLHPSGPVTSYFAQMGVRDHGVAADVTIVEALTGDPFGTTGLRLESHVMGSVADGTQVEDTPYLTSRLAELDGAQQDICAGLLVSRSVDAESQGS